MRKTSVVMLVIIVLALIGGALFYLKESRGRLANLNRASDAPKMKGEITVAGDNYLGYWFLTSDEFLRNLRSKAYAFNWLNDGGDYPGRLKAFNEGKYDIIVLPVNSYVLHGKDYYYPGVIPSVISDSKGADNIVAWLDRLADSANRQPTVNDLNNSNLKFCFTPDSPSSFLLDTAILDFDLNSLKTNNIWRVETKGGSREAYERFVKRECDVAVLWEPDVSKALTLPGAVSVFGSDQIFNKIIDVFVARRNLIVNEQEKVAAFFQAYYETLAYYDKNRDQMFSEMQRTKDGDNKLIFKSRDEVEKAVGRVAWFNFNANYQDWFGLGVPVVMQTPQQGKLIDSILGVTRTMFETGDLKTDPVVLVDGKNQALKNNPYAITNSEILKRFYGKIQADANIGAQIPLNRIFSQLSDADWSGLKSIGTMRIMPILFQPGTALLTMDSKTTVDQAAVTLAQNYPQYRILIRGHTARSSDAQGDLALSQERADSVKRYWETIHGIDPNRIMALGVGSSEPFPRFAGEGELSYRSRLTRVEFILLEDR